MWWPLNADMVTLPIAGFVVGFLVGLTGMGGAVLMTPLLLFGFGLPPSLAVGTDLLYSLLTKIAGAWQHVRQGTVDFGVVRQLAYGSVPATLCAVVLLGVLQQGHAARLEAWLGRAIGCALFLAALLLLRGLRAPRAGAEPGASRPRLVMATGALGGVLVGLTSVGSGSVILALLVFACPLPPPRLVGTDVAHAVVLVAVAALGHGILGTVDVGIALALAVGSVPGAIFGSRLVTRAPRRLLVAILATLLLATAIRLLS